MRPPLFHWKRTVAAVVATGVAAATLQFAAAPALAAPVEPPAPALAAAAGVMINEVSAAAWKSIKDEDGDAKDWVELYNSSTVTADISYWGLSNKATSTFRWAFPAKTTIPARGYLTVWLSKKDKTKAGSPLHASFNLDNGSDSLYLSIPDGTSTGVLVDSATPARTEADKTWCRMPSGSITSPFGYCDKATRNAANTGAFTTTMAATPTISPAGGVFATGQTVTIAAQPGAEIRYTVDGNDPVATSKLYTGPIAVSASQSVRARAFVAGSATSLQATESYVIDATEAQLYADQKVLMVTMTPAEVKLMKAANKDARFATTFDLRDGNGATIFKGNAESTVGGSLGSVGSQANMPLNISLRDSLGAKDFTYALFPNKGTQTIEKFRLRNSGNDWYYARMRDAFAHNLVAETDTLWSDFTPTVVFVNGQYNGLMDLREREDGTMVEQATQTSKDAVQFINQGRDIEGGAAARQAWTDIKNYFSRTNMSVPANYAEAEKRVDIQSVADVTAAYSWAAVWDWPWKNFHAWRSAATDNKWHMKVHDFDISMDITPAKAFGAPTSAKENVYSKLGNNEQAIFASLIKSPQFKDLYANTVADQLNYTFDPVRTNAKLDQFVAMIEPYMAEFRAKNPSLGTAAQWKTTDVARLRAFLNERNANIDKQTQTQYKLSPRIPVTVGVNDQSQGAVKLNSLDLTGKFTAAGTFTGSYYPEVPITVTAQPKPGYTFVRWEGSSSSTDAQLTLAPKDAKSLTAVFTTVKKVPAPAFTEVGAQTTLTGEVVDLQVTATDPSGLPLTYTAKSLPKGVGVDPASGHLWGKATTPDTTKAKITATNGVSSTTYTIAWTIEDRPNTGVKSQPLAGAVTTSYWKNATLTGEPAATGISPITFNLGTAAPLTGFPVDNFSMRFETSILPSQTGDYGFRTITAPYDGVRVWFDDQLVIDSWVPTSTNNKTTEATVPMTAGKRVAVRVEYKDTSGAAALSFDWKKPGGAGYTLIPASVMTVAGIPAQSTVPQPTIAPITRQLWKNRNLTGDPAQTTYFEQAMAMALPSGVAPEQGFPNDNFGVRWTTQFTPAESGTHSFTVSKSSYDGARLYVDGKLVVDSWTTTSTDSNAEGSIDLVAGKPVELRLDYFDSAYDATVSVSVKLPSAYGRTSLPAPTLAGGITPVQPALGPITAEYWKSKAMTGAPTNTLPYADRIGLDLANGVTPIDGYPAVNYGVRWTTTLTPATTGSYVLRATDSSSDGVRISIDGKTVLDDWTSQTLDHQVAVDLTAGRAVKVVVDYFNGAREALLALAVAVPGSTTFESLAAPVVAGQTPAAAPVLSVQSSQWWKNITLAGAPVVTDARPIALDEPGAPYTGFPTSNWSVRWDATLSAQQSGDYLYRITKTTNDRARVYVDDRLVLDNWKSTSPVDDLTIPLTAGTPTKLRVEFYNAAGAAKLNLAVRTPGSATFAAAAG